MTELIKQQVDTNIQPEMSEYVNTSQYSLALLQNTISYYADVYKLGEDIIEVSES